MVTSNRDNLSQAELLRMIQGMEENAAFELHEHARIQNSLQDDNRVLRTQNDVLQKSNDKLEASLDQYMLLYQHAPIPCICVDSKGIIRQMNQAGAGLLAASTPTALCGLSVLTFLAENDRAAFLAHLKQTFLFRKIETTELRIIAGGQDRLMLIHSIAMPGSSPDQASCWSTFTDITDLKRAEEAIRSAGVNVKAIFDNAGHPMWSVDRAYTIIASNDAFRELWSRLEPTSMIDQILKGLYARAFSGERSTLEQSFFVALDPDGKHREERRFEFCFNPIQVEGQITAVCVAARDITERHNIETRLVHAKESAEEKTRLKSNFLSSMSHELRTPLTAIVANCNVIQELAGADASVQQYVKIIEENSKQLIDIINDILDLARLESRRNDFAGEFVEPVACVQKVVKMLEPMAKKKSVMLSIGRPIVPLKIFVNPSYLERILTNLVGNAIKFTNNGTIIINVAEENIHDVRRVSISVVDTGVGISESFLPYIFDEFRREHHDGSEGSGLGLTITKKLVESMNGSIEIRSSEGKGTTVSVSFPKINHDMEEQSANPASQPIRTMSKMDYRVN